MRELIGILKTILDQGDAWIGTATGDLYLNDDSGRDFQIVLTPPQTAILRKFLWKSSIGRDSRLAREAHDDA